MSQRYVVRLNAVANRGKHWRLLTEESFSNPYEQEIASKNLKYLLEQPDLELRVSKYEEETETDKEE